MATFAHGADLQTVDSVLARMGKRDAGESKGLSPAASLMKDILAFRERAPHLKAQAAAVEWIALWDRSLDIGTKPATRDYDSYDVATRSPLGPPSLLAALPAPEAWPLIRAEAKLRATKAPDDPSALGLKLIAEVLTHDMAAASKSLAAYERLASSGGPGEREFKLQAIGEAQVLLYKLYGTREQIAEGFQNAVDGHAKQAYDIGVEVPDLVGLMGEAKAEALLVYALRKPVSLRVPEGVATKAMARKLALREVAVLRKAQWGLVDSLGTFTLYEALQARFDPRTDASVGASAEETGSMLAYERRQADLYYFLDMVVAGRHAEAELAMVRASGNGNWLNVPRQAMAELSRRGQSAAVCAFLADLLGRRPQLPVWDFYLEQAGTLGRSSEAMALLDKVLARTDLTAALRAELLEKRLDALLGADQVDAAVAGFRVLLAAPPSRDDPKLGQRTAAAIRLAGLGRVLKHPERSRSGVDYSAQAMALQLAPQQSHWRAASLRALLAELRREGLADRAQALALAELERESETPGFKGFAAFVVDPAKRTALVELVGLYDAAGRFDDVRRMLDEAGIWAARDIGEFVAEKDSLETPIGLMAARALKAGGNMAGATLAARAVMAQLPGHDPAYQLFVELAGPSAITELDRMATSDPFEERPLVWKAVALAKARQYDAAEETVRRAIAIDPSDGEQGVNDRMRAYAVLADILEAKGDAKAAQGFRSAVAAIRLSEQADELQKLGLYQRAFAGYRAALAEFSDAYCIQSRLAVQLARLGFQNEALKHYRRAFELMPDSFGRVESHCFGCESVFAGPSAQSVAEEVFTELLKRGAIKPQVSYMLGYLRKEQGRYDEAVVLFRNAITLDALYLNAWRQLNDLGEKTYIDPGERDIARLRLFELDPGQRHVRYDLNEVADLASLWRALAARAVDGERAGQAKVESVYPLQGSIRARQEALAKLPPDMRMQMEQYVELQAAMTGPAAGAGVAPGLASHKLVAAALQLMRGSVFGAE